MVRTPRPLLLAALALGLGLFGCGAGAPVTGLPDGGDGGDTGPGVDIPPFPVPDGPSTDLIDGGTPGLLGPPYPIVLAHGFFGFDQFAGLDFVTYFYEVKDLLAQAGELLIYTPQVDPFNSSSEVRGPQLQAQVEQILAETGKAKVVIVGHSQGGLDARYVANQLPDRVAAVVTWATPNRGTPLSDVVLGVVPFEGAQEIIDAFVRLIGGPLYDEVGNETSLVTALRQFSTPGIEDFNSRFPDGPGVSYYSITGRSVSARAEKECATPDEVAFVTPWKDTTDSIEPLLAPVALVMGDAPHDGLVPVTSARWGTFWGCVPADHFDEIGQLFGDGPGPDNDWSYRAFYLDLVEHLRKLGY